MRLSGDCSSRLLGVLAPLVVLIVNCEAALDESSYSYLRNVVGELQLLNNGLIPDEPLPVNRPTNVEHRDQVVLRPYRSRSRSRRRPLVRHDHAATEEELLCRQVRAHDDPNYLQQQQQQQQQQTETSIGSRPLGLTTTELAAMYRKALESGASLKYTSLVDGLQGQSSRPEPDDHQYAYYFYPLQSFSHELAPSHGYRTVPHFKYDSAPAEDSKKETSTANPLLVGISSFLGMALLFVLSMFFYPRFMHYMHFPFVTTSRTSFQNEFAHLATFVTEAIDHYSKRVRKKSRLSPSIIQMR